MLSKKDILKIEDFDYFQYLQDNPFHELLGLDLNEKSFEKKVYPPNFSVDQNNNIPFPAELDDLIRLHYITTSRKVTTILEFGVGMSTVVFADAISRNFKYKKDIEINLRRNNLFECHSIDNNNSWIKECEKRIPNLLKDKGISKIHLCNLITGLFNDRLCTYYENIPNISPDLIYLDAPDQFSPLGEIRGLSTKHPDRMPMAADILTIEHFLQPGTLIIVDGRTANARFLEVNLQRAWAYYYSSEWDQHFFELQELPLGIYNKRMIDFCLGDDYYKRLNFSSLNK